MYYVRGGVVYREGRSVGRRCGVGGMVYHVRGGVVYHVRRGGVVYHVREGVVYHVRGGVVYHVREEYGISCEGRCGISRVLYIM